MKLTASPQNAARRNESKPSAAPAAAPFDAAAHARFGHNFSQMAAASETPIQRAEDRDAAGLPANLRSGAESLSGLSLDDVSIHRGSPQPAQLQALAYAQGTDIHLGAGQEQHLPHEAWHVVQQQQGRVRPTLQIAGQEPE